MIEIDTSKMQSKIKNNIEPPFVIKTLNDFYYLCAYESGSKLKLVSLQNGWIQESNYTLEELLNNGYEVYKSTLSIMNKLA